MILQKIIIIFILISLVSSIDIKNTQKNLLEKKNEDFVDAQFVSHEHLTRVKSSLLKKLGNDIIDSTKDTNKDNNNNNNNNKDISPDVKNNENIKDNNDNNNNNNNNDVESKVKNYNTYNYYNTHNKNTNKILTSSEFIKRYNEMNQMSIHEKMLEMYRLHKDLANEMNSNFERIDLDKNGKLSWFELEKEDLTPQRTYSKILKSFDVNNDSSIDLYEWSIGPVFLGNSNHSDELKILQKRIGDNVKSDLRFMQERKGTTPINGDAHELQALVEKKGNFGGSFGGSLTTSFDNPVAKSLGSAVVGGAIGGALKGAATGDLNAAIGGALGGALGGAANHAVNEAFGGKKKETSGPKLPTGPVVTAPPKSKYGIPTSFDEGCAYCQYLYQRIEDMVAIKLEQVNDEQMGTGGNGGSTSGSGSSGSSAGSASGSGEIGDEMHPFEDITEEHLAKIGIYVSRSIPLRKKDHLAFLATKGRRTGIHLLKDFISEEVDIVCGDESPPLFRVHCERFINKQSFLAEGLYYSVHAPIVCAKMGMCGPMSYINNPEDAHSPENSFKFNGGSGMCGFGGGKLRSPNAPGSAGALCKTASAMQTAFLGSIQLPPLA